MHFRRTGLHRYCTIAAALFLIPLAPVSSGASAAPAAIDQDPPIDHAHPAVGAGLQFTSHGKRVNAMLYLPAGAGPHPAVILLHGLPGNEQNLDLARAMQRAGWAVVTFHYRGSWGSGGTFALGGGCDDVDSLLEDISSADGSAKWHIDPRRIVIMVTAMAGSSRAAPPGVIPTWPPWACSRHGIPASIRDSSPS